MAASKKATEDLIRQEALGDLKKFINLVAPHRVLGHVHEDLINWWTREDSKSHQLVLLPRDHAKSAMIAYRVAWEIVKNPAITVLYISSTSNLAEKQLKMIKDILTSKWVTMFWPDLINPEEGKREKWTNSEIAVDHPLRKLEGIRDPTVFTGGLTTSLTGLHCNIAVLDDVVVQENAYTTDGREKVKTQYSLLASIESADAREWVVGTRYHPKDLYYDLMEMEQEIFDSSGNIIDTAPVYELFERAVEDRGDGTGEFIWPRQQRTDGKWFGFDARILSKKKAQYLDKTQFYAQYYNDPNAWGNSDIDPTKFQYYDKAHVSRNNGKWFVMGKLVNVYAAIDFAFSLSTKADYTAIVVVGVDADRNVYVLDIDRFRADRIADCFRRIRDLHLRWDFRKLRAEMTVAQAAVVRELKEMYIKPEGLALSIDEFFPTRHQGSKEERMAAILQPRYDNNAIWHYRGGNCQLLEEELLQSKPAHDDIKDALSAAIDVSIPPIHAGTRRNTSNNIIYSSRFGGVQFR